MKVQAYAVLEANKGLEPFEYDAPDPGDNDVRIDISHCGICYSDVHMIRDDVGMTTYPFVPGHEIIGTVSAVGRDVKDLREGQRVGVGWQAGSCGHCEWCVRGQENACPEMPQNAIWGARGGFASSTTLDSRFAFPLPDTLDNATTGPLMCGGITVYSPLRNIRPTMAVGVIGIGGLGHLAIQFANAFGCEVTAFSSTAAKKQEALLLGAHHFIDSTDTEQLQQVARSLDVVICTAHADMDWTAYMATLKPYGKLYVIGVPGGTINIEPMALIFGQVSVCGSVIGGRQAIREMLGFAARSGVVARCEQRKMSEVNAAVGELERNAVRYRVVLAN